MYYEVETDMIDYQFICLAQQGVINQYPLSRRGGGRASSYHSFL